MPELVQEVKPMYTAEAMRSKLQGIVVLECVVQVDGTIGDVTISIDRQGIWPRPTGHQGREGLAIPAGSSASANPCPSS